MMDGNVSKEKMTEGMIQWLLNADMAEMMKTPEEEDAWRNMIDNAAKHVLHNMNIMIIFNQIQEYFFFFLLLTKTDNCLCSFFSNSAVQPINLLKFCVILIFRFYYWIEIDF